MRRTTKSYEIEEKYSDHLDAIKEAGVKVHTKTKGTVLSKNFVLAHFGEEKEKYNTFIIREMIAAEMIRQYIADKPTGDELASLIEKESEAHAILNRNNKNNPVVMGIINREKDEQIEEEESKKENGIIKRIRGSIKPKDEKEKDKDD